MGMGYGANFADCISETDLADIVGNDLINAFYEAADAAEIDDLCDWVNDWENCDSTAVYTAITKIEQVFHEKTGLEVSLQYHSEEDGDRYDEITGYFWAVDGMYVLSDAGQKLESKVVRNFYVSFG